MEKRERNELIVMIGGIYEDVTEYLGKRVTELMKHLDPTAAKTENRMAMDLVLAGVQKRHPDYSKPHAYDVAKYAVIAAYMDHDQKPPAEKTLRHILGNGEQYYNGWYKPDGTSDPVQCGKNWDLMKDLTEWGVIND